MSISAYARRIKEAQDEVRQIAPFSASDGDFDVAAAYEVAGLVHRERLAQGRKPVGRKIGFTNPEMWKVYGVNAPIWGYVYDSTVVFRGEAEDECSLRRFADPKIEPEIVLGLGAAPPTDSDSILDCIDWVAHGFEIVQSHYPGWKFKAADTVADGGLHGALLIGKPQKVRDLGPGLRQQLETLTLSLFKDGALLEKGRGANVFGSPLKALAHLVAVLQSQPSGAPLQAGELVTTGTITAAYPVAPGERWHTEIQGISLPGLSVRFVS